MNQHSNTIINGTNSGDLNRDKRKETIGWISLIAIMFLFPALFYLCVFFPIWIGLTPRW